MQKKKIIFKKDKIRLRWSQTRLKKRRTNVEISLPTTKKKIIAQGTPRKASDTGRITEDN